MGREQDGGCVKSRMGCLHRDGTGEWLSAGKAVRTAVRGVKRDRGVEPIDSGGMATKPGGTQD